MAKTANISISLPVDTIDAVRRYARGRKSTVSAAVRESLVRMIRTVDEEAIEKQIAEYYADPRVQKEDRALAGQMFRASAWWEEVHGRQRPTEGRRSHRRLRRRR